MSVGAAPLRVAYLISTSAANRALNGLVDHTSPDDVTFSAIVLDDGRGPLRDDMAGRGVTTVGLPAVGWRGVPVIARRLPEVMRQLRLDIVHSNLFLPGLGTELARAGRRRTPASVYTRHHNNQHHEMGKRVHVAIDGFTARRATRVIAVAGAVATTMTSAEAVPAVHIDVVHNGFDWSATRPSETGIAEWRRQFPGPLLVAVGRLDPVKDLPSLVRAAGLVRRRIADVSLVLAGDGPTSTEAELDAVAAAAGMSDRFHRLGYVERVFDLMAAADVFVQASTDEACSQTIVEAAGLGIPLAVTTTGGTSEIVGSFHPPLRARDPEALAARILSLLADPHAARAAATAAAPDVQDRFSIDRQAAGHLATYRRAMADHRRRR